VGGGTLPTDVDVDVEEELTVSVPQQVDGRPTVPPERPAVLQRFGRSAWALTGLLVVAAALWLGLSRVALIVVPLLLALFPAAVLQAPARWLERRGVPARLAALLVLLAAVLLVGGIVALAVPAVTARADELGVGVQQGIDRLQQFLGSRPLGLPPVDLREVVDGVREVVLQGGFNQRLLGLASTVLTGLAMLVTGLFALFFYLADGYRIADWLRGLFVARVRDDVGEVARRAWDSLRGYALGLLGVAAFDAVAIGVGFAVVVGTGLALSLAVITFLTAFVPFVGAIIPGAIATLVALALGGTTDALIVLGIVVVVQQVEGNIVSPLVMGRAVSLHPLAVLVVLTAGAALLGILGALIAVPVAAATHAGASYLRERYGW